MDIKGTPSTGPTNNQQSATGADKQSRGDVDQNSADDFSKALKNDKAKQDQLPMDGKARSNQLPMDGKVRSDQLPTDGKARQDQLPMDGKARSDQLPTGGKARQDQLPMDGKARSDQLPTGGKARQDQLPMDGKARSDQLPTGGKARQDQLPMDGKARSDQLPTGSKARQPEGSGPAIDKKDILHDENQSKSQETDKKSPEDLFRSVYSNREQEHGAQALHAKGADISATGTTEVRGVNTQAVIDKIDKIVEHIQVQTAGDVKTVNIKLNNSILPGTEVVFRREGGDIKIEFTTTSADSFNFLSKGEHVLSDTLNRKFGDNVYVDIQLQSDSDSDQPDDGRSRNQYVEDESQDDGTEDNG